MLLKRALQIRHKKMNFSARTFTFAFSSLVQPYIMGVLNVTPDSFSDGNRYCKPDTACEHAQKMVTNGAQIIDIGAESTRPGSTGVSVEEELKRLVPVLECLGRSCTVPLSIDTSKASVAEECLKRGASIINDVYGCKKDPDIATVVKDYEAGLILMHMRGQPQTMHALTDYADVIGDIVNELQESIAIATDAGVPFENIMVDPGIGFAKTVEQNIEIIRRLKELAVLKRPIVLGTSRKSFIGISLGREVHERLSGTLASIVCGIDNGAHVVRVHDVKEVHDFLKMIDLINS
jgi:dihydropteroate synthase